MLISWLGSNSFASKKFPLEWMIRFIQSFFEFLKTGNYYKKNTVRLNFPKTGI